MKIFFKLFIYLIDLIHKNKIVNFLKKILPNKSLKIIDVGAHHGETVKLFIKNANYSTAIILSSKDDFLKLTDYNYPKFFVINKNGIISSYKASFFQERTIDKLSNAEL